MSGLIPMIDHSAWQWPGYDSKTGLVRLPIARPDFTKAQALGVVGIKTRAVNGLRPDPTFPISCEAIHDVGLQLGAYQYLRPDKGTGRQNAEAFAQAVNTAPRTPSFLVADAEGSAEGLTIPQFVDWFGEWGDVLRAETGRFVLRYTADWWWNPEAGASHGDYDTIVAAYGGGVPPSDTALWEAFAYRYRKAGPRLPAGEDHWDGWQFTSSLTAADFGYPANASTSRLDGNLIRLDSWARWTLDPTTPDIPPPGPVIVTGEDMFALRSPQTVFDTRDGFNSGKGVPTEWADWIDIQHPELDSAFVHITVNARAAGFVKVWDPTADSEPKGATVDFDRAGIFGTSALVPVNAGRIFLKTSVALADLIIIVQGGVAKV